MPPIVGSNNNRRDDVSSDYGQARFKLLRNLWRLKTLGEKTHLQCLVVMRLQQVLHFRDHQLAQAFALGLESRNKHSTIALCSQNTGEAPID